MGGLGQAGGIPQEDVRNMITMRDFLKPIVYKVVQ